MNPRRGHASYRAVWLVFRKYFLGPHWANLLLVMVLGGLFGSGPQFFYAWTGRFVADEVVQVQMLAANTSEAAKLDPAMPGETRRFALDQPHHRTSWSQRLESTQGRSLAEKLRLVTVLAALLAGVLVLRNLGSWFLGERVVHVGQKVQFQMRHRLYEKLHALPMSYHDRNSVGALMTHLFSDVSVIQKFTISLLQSIPTNVLTIAVAAGIMMSIDPGLTGLVLLALPAYGLSYRWFRHRLKTVHGNLREREGRLNAHVANRIKNFYLVKGFVRETFESIEFLRKSRPIVRDRLAASVLGSLFGIACGIISGVCMVAVLWIGTLRVRDGGMTLGTLLLFYASAGFMFAPVAALTSLASTYHRLSAVCHKVMRVLDELVTLADPENSLPVPAAAPEIRFENVALCYNDNRPPAVKDLTFTVPAGKTLCIMGPSGSGKTTLAKLACRIYDPTTGTVRLNETDIRDFRIADLRKLAGFVSQEPVIFEGTIRDNIRYGSEQSPFGDVVTAAQYAQIHDFIDRLPGQYQTPTHERGLTLSGGQKQRVNLARVLLYDPKVLVLDDCTSALDAETEAKLVEDFQVVLRDRTALLVSHRISIAMRCDLIAMLKDGQIAEFGSPDELLQREGPFAELCREQTDDSRTLRLQPA